MNSIHYISWRTWQEEEVTTPWVWYPLQQGHMYKKRTSCKSSLTVTEELVADAFQTKNQSLLDEINQNYIQDVELASFIVAESENQAVTEILQYFPDAEITRCQQIEPQTKQQILELFDQAIRKKELGK
jgi:hypothetical protein